MKKIYSLMVLVMSLFISQSIQALTYTVTVPEGTNVCYLIGDINEWKLENAILMEKVNATTFTTTIDNATEDQGYKYLSGPSFEYEEAIDAEGTSLPENRNWSANDVVAFWKKVFVPTDATIEVQVSNDVHVMYIVGSFNNWTFDEMQYVDSDPNGKIFTFTIPNADIDNVMFKFCAGSSWTYEQLKSLYPTEFKCDSDHLFEGVYAYYVEAFEDIYDPTNPAGRITITATVPAGTEEVWLQGTIFNWGWDNPDTMKMTKNADGTFSFTTDEIQSMQYRLYNGAGWDYPEVGEDNPTTERSNRGANFGIDGANVAITVWGWLVPGGPSSLSNTTNNDLDIYTTGNQIIIEGETSQVALFDITGKLIQSQAGKGKFTSKTLPEGLYIISVDGSARKVMVK